MREDKLSKFLDAFVNIGAAAVVAQALYYYVKITSVLTAP